MSVPAITTNTLYGFKFAGGLGGSNTFRGINIADATFSVVSVSDPLLQITNFAVSGTENASNGTPITTVSCTVIWGTTSNSNTSSGTASCVIRATRPGNIFRDFTFNVEFAGKTGAPTTITPSNKACQTSGSFTLNASDLFSMAGRDGVLTPSQTNINNSVRTGKTSWTIWPSASPVSATMFTVSSNGLSAFQTSNSLNVTFSGTATTTTVSGSLSAAFGHGVLYEIPYSGRAPSTLDLSNLPAGLSVLKLGVRYFIAGSPTAAGTFTATATGSGNTGSVSINVTAATPIIEDTSLSITITRGMFLNYPVRLASTYSLPVSWAVTGGTLPAGITLNSTTGVLSGTTASSIASVVITITATGGGGTTTKTYNLILKNFEYASCLHFNQPDENIAYDAATGTSRLLFNDAKLIKLPDSYKNRELTPPESNTESIFFHNTNVNNYYPFFIEIYENSLGELLFEEKDFLVEVFINLTDFPTNDWDEYPIYSSGANGFNAFKIALNKNQLYCVINNSTKISYYHGFELNKWYHITVERRGGELSLYIDGNKATSVENTENIYNQKKFILGADAGAVYSRRKNYLRSYQEHVNGFQGHLKAFRILTGSALDYLEREGIAFYPNDYLPNIPGEVPSVRNHSAIVFTEGWSSSITTDEIDTAVPGISNQIFVWGAGLGSLNGWYTQVGFQQSRPLYRKNDSEASIGYNAGVWYISTISTFSGGVTYTSTSNSITVPISGWTSGSPSNNPVPSVSNTMPRWRDVNIGKPGNTYKPAWVQFPFGDVPTMTANRVCVEGWFRIRPGQNWNNNDVGNDAILQHYGTPGSNAYNTPWDIWVDDSGTLRIVDGSSNFRFSNFKVPYHRWFHLSLTIPFGLGATNQVAYLHIDGKFIEQINNWSMGGWTPGDNTKALRLCGDGTDSREYVDVYDYRLSFGTTANRYSTQDYSSHLNRLSTTPVADTYFLVTAEDNGLANENFKFIWRKNIGGVASQGNLIATHDQYIVQVGPNSWDTNEGVSPGSTPVFNSTSASTTTTVVDVSAVRFRFTTPRMVGGTPWGPNPAILDSSRHNRYNKKLFTTYPVLFSNEVTKFGRGALLCEKANGVATWSYDSASNQNLNSDFTLEFWYNCFSPSLHPDFDYTPPLTAWEQAMIDLGGSIKITSRPYFGGLTTSSSQIYTDPGNQVYTYQLKVYIGNNNDFTTGVNGEVINAVNYNTWNHFALVKTGEYYTVYHQGIPVRTWRITQVLTPSGNFTVGGNLIDSNFLGLIDDFRLTKNPQVYNMTGADGSFALPTAQQPPYLVPEVQDSQIYVNAFQDFAVFPKIIKNYDQPGTTFYFTDDILDEEEDYSYYFENLGIDGTTGELYGQLNTIAENRPYRVRYHIDLPSGQTTSTILSFFSTSSFNLSQGPTLPFTEQILTDKAVLYIPSTGRFLINAQGKLYLYDPTTNSLEQKVYSAFGRNASGLLGIVGSALSIDNPQDYEWAASWSHVYIRVRRSDQIDYSVPNSLQSNLYSLSISGNFNDDLSNNSIKTITNFNGYNLGNISPTNPTTVYYTAMAGAVETVYSLSTNATNIVSTVTTIEPHSRPFNIFTSCPSFKRSSHGFSGLNFTFGENASDFRWFFGGFSSINPRYIYELLVEQKEVNYLNNNFEYWHHLTPLFQISNPDYYTHLNSYGGTYFILFQDKSFANNNNNFSIFGPNIDDSNTEIKCSLPRKNPADSTSPFYRPLSLAITKKEDPNLQPPSEKYILTILANDPTSQNISVLSTEFTTYMVNVMKPVSGPWSSNPEINMASNGSTTIAYIDKGLTGFTYVSDNSGGKWRAVPIAGGSASHYSMTYGNNLFMYVRWMGNSTPIIYTTSNFSTFQNKNFISTGNDLPAGTFINNIAFGQGKWVLTTNVAGLNYVSTNNGDSWTRISNLNSQTIEFKGVKFVNNIWFLFRPEGGAYGSYVCHASTDATTWVEIHSYPPGEPDNGRQQAPYRDVVYHNGNYIFYAASGAYKRTSNIWSTSGWAYTAWRSTDETTVWASQMVSFGAELLAFQLAAFPNSYTVNTFNYFVSTDNGSSWIKKTTTRPINTPIGGAILGPAGDNIVSLQINRGTATVYQGRTYVPPNNILPIKHVKDLPLSGAVSSFSEANPNTPTMGFYGISPRAINDYEAFIFTNERGPQILKYIPGGKNVISSISANYFKNKNINNDKFLIYDSVAFPKNVEFSSTEHNPVHTTGKFKKGLLLQEHKLTIKGTASNTSIDIPNREYYVSDIFHNNPFSFEAWFYIDKDVDPWGGSLFYLDQGDGTMEHHAIDLRLDYPGVLRLRIMVNQSYAVGDWNSYTTIFNESYFESNVDKKWTHVALSRASDGYFNVYINGTKPYVGRIGAEANNTLNGSFNTPLDISVCDNLRAKVSDIQITKGESIWTKPGTQQSSGYTANMLTPAYGGPLRGNFLLHNRNEIFSTASINRFFYPSGDPFDENWKFIVNALDGDAPSQYQQYSILDQFIGTASTYTSNLKKTRFNFKLVDKTPRVGDLTTNFNPFILIDGSSGTGGSLPQNTIYFPFNEAVGVSTFTFGGMSLTQITSTPYHSDPQPNLAIGTIGGWNGVHFNNGFAKHLVLSNQKNILSFGTGDFTVSFWAYSTQAPTYVRFLSAQLTQGWGVELGAYFGHIKFGSYLLGEIQVQASLPINQWAHIAFTRTNGIFRAFVNGQQRNISVSGSGVVANVNDNSNYLDSSGTTNKNLTIGAFDGFPFSGYIRDLFISKGTSLYQTNFTPPSSAIANGLWVDNQSVPASPTAVTAISKSYTKGTFFNLPVTIGSDVNPHIILHDSSGRYYDNFRYIRTGNSSGKIVGYVDNASIGQNIELIIGYKSYNYIKQVSNPNIIGAEKGTPTTANSGNLSLSLSFTLNVAPPQLGYLEYSMGTFVEIYADMEGEVCDWGLELYAYDLPPGLDWEGVEGECGNPTSLRIFGTPTAAGSYNPVLVAIDTDGQEIEGSFELFIDPGFSVGQISPVTANQNQQFTINVPLVLSSPTLPITATLSGFPAGSFSYNGTTKQITGTATAAGIFNPTITFTAYGNSLSETFSLTIVEFFQIITPQNTTLAKAAPMTPIEFRYIGSPTQVDTITSTALPPGLSLVNEEDRQYIEGTPTEVSDYYGDTVTITITTFGGLVRTASFSIKVTVQITLDVANSTLTYLLGTALPSLVLETSGPTPCTRVSIPDLNDLPDGLTYNETTRTISGTFLELSQDGYYGQRVDVTLWNGGDAFNVYFYFRINLGLTVEEIEDKTYNLDTDITPIPILISGNFNWTTISVTGLEGSGLYWDDTSGDQPVILGVAESSGIHQVVVRVYVYSNYVEQTFRITIIDAIDFTMPVNPIFPKFITITPLVISISGNISSLLFANLPPGLSFNSTNMSIQGTPTQTGTYNVTATAYNSNGIVLTKTEEFTVVEGTQDFFVVPNQTFVAQGRWMPGLMAAVNDPSILTGWVPPANSGAYRLPTGITQDPVTGIIRGLATEQGNGQFYLTAIVEGDEFSASANWIVIFRKIELADITINVVRGRSASVQLTYTQDVPTRWVLNSPLPAGLSMTTAVTMNMTTGTISGGLITGITNVPNGVYTVIITAEHEIVPAFSTTKTYTINVGLNFIEIPSFLDLTAEVNLPFLVDIPLEGEIPATWEVSSGNAGPFSITSLGEIVGTPLVTGSFSFTVLARLQNIVSNECEITIDVFSDGDGGGGGTGAPNLSNATIRANLNTPFTFNLINTGGVIDDYEFGNPPQGVSISQVSNGFTISGTVTTSGVYTFDLSVSNSGGTDTSTITIIVSDGRPIIPDNQSFSFVKSETLPGTDKLNVLGETPTSISFSTLPSGIVFNPAAYTFTGTAPATTGETSHNVSASNLSGSTGDVPVKFIIKDAAITITPNQIFELTESAGSFSRNIATTGGTPTGGTLEFAPAGVQLFFNPARLAGTTPPVGNYNIRVTLTNFGNTTTEFITLIVGAQLPIITPNQTFTGTTNTNAAFTVVSTGGVPTAWGIPTPTQLPPGLTFSLSQGRFTGTPTTAGTFIVGVFAQNSAGTTPTANVTITISQGVVKPEIPAGQKVDLVTGQQVSNVFVQTTGGTPTSWAATGLPQGLSISTTTGQISGTLNAAATTTTSNITASNSAGSSTQSVEFRITQPITIPVITAGQAFTFVLNGTITTDSRILFTGTGATLTSQNLPSGVSMDGNTGRLQGRPLTAGVFNATITARNSAGTDTETVSITVTSPTTQIPVLAQSLSPIQLVRNVNMTPYNFINSGGIATTWAASNLPQGLSFNFSTGTISGRPTATENKTVTITATNSSGTATTTLAINVVSSVTAPVINNQTINAFRGTHFSFQLEATGTITNWLVDNSLNNSLPQGISLSAVIGTIAGIPTSTGTFTTTIKVENESGSDTAVITIIVASSALVPVITPNQTFVGRKGVNFNYTIGFLNSGGTPTGWRLATTQTLLHPGITLDGINGYLSGIPTTAGNTSTQLIASNSAGDSTPVTVNFQITESINAPNITQGQIFKATLNTPFSRNITFSGNVTEWRIVTGELPAGLTLNGSTGAISGTPTVYSGSRTIRIFAGNPDGSDEENITVAVDEPAIVVSPGQSFNGYALDPFTATVRAQGNPISWQLTNLPTSLNLTINNTGIISGTPGIAGEYTGVVTATGVSGISGSASIKINILSKVPVIIPNQVINLSTANFITYSIAFSSAGGTPPTQWAALTPLPQGLTLNASRGIISGTPTQATSATGVDCDIKVENSYGASSEKIKIIVAAVTSLLKINPEQTVIVNVGTLFEFTPTYVGVPTRWYILNIPAGLSIDATTGKISGTISTAGTYRVCVYCENARFDASAFINIKVN